MKESPLFAQLKTEGKTSVNPIKESFGHKANFKMVLLALFGAVMGQGVIWYTGQFYAQSFLETKCNIEFEQSRTLLLWAIVFATPFFIFFGWLSDKIGRKWIMMAGMLLAILTYRPVFKTFLRDSSVAKLTVKEGKMLNQKFSFSRNNQDSLSTTETRIVYENGMSARQIKVDTCLRSIYQYKEVVPKTKIIYAEKHLPPAIYWKFVALTFLLIFYVTMVYGPIAAFLVEMFPTKIRYTSMSLPYHIGNGVFGGLVPFIGLLLTTTFTTDALVGLWYPIGVAVLCFIIGTIYLTNKIDKDVMD